METKRALKCCVCGEPAGQWQQHHNQDTGWGICPRCVANLAATESPKELASRYGLPGVNYEQPLVRYMGRQYHLLATTKEEDVANAFMLRTPGAALLTIEDGIHMLVDEKDLGQPVIRST